MTKLFVRIILTCLIITVSFSSALFGKERPGSKDVTKSTIDVLFVGYGAPRRQQEQL